MLYVVFFSAAKVHQGHLLVLKREYQSPFSRYKIIVCRMSSLTWHIPPCPHKSLDVFTTLTHITGPTKKLATIPALLVSLFSPITSILCKPQVPMNVQLIAEGEGLRPGGGPLQGALNKAQPRGALPWTPAVRVQPCWHSSGYRVARLIWMIVFSPVSLAKACYFLNSI